MEAKKVWVQEVELANHPWPAESKGTERVSL